MKKGIMLVLSIVLLLCLLSNTVFARMQPAEIHYSSLQEYETRIVKGDLPELFIPYDKISFLGKFGMLTLPNTRLGFSTVTYHLYNCKGEKFSFAIKRSDFPEAIVDSATSLEDLRHIDTSEWGTGKVVLQRFGMQDVIFWYEEGFLKNITLKYKNRFFSFAGPYTTRLSELTCTCTDNDDSYICRLLNPETSPAAIAELKTALAYLEGDAPLVTTTTVPTPPPPQNEPNPLRYLVIPVAIVAVGGTVGLVWYRVRKKKD